MNPRAAPRRTVSAVITPGGAQNAMARKKDEMKRDIIFRRQTEVLLGLSFLRHFVIASGWRRRNDRKFSSQNTKHIHVESGAGGPHPLHKLACI